MLQDLLFRGTSLEAQFAPDLVVVHHRDEPFGPALGDKQEELGNSARWVAVERLNARKFNAIIDEAALQDEERNEITRLLPFRQAVLEYDEHLPREVEGSANRSCKRPSRRASPMPA